MDNFFNINVFIIIIISVLSISIIISVLVYYRLYQIKFHEQSLIVAQHEVIINSKVKTLDRSILQRFSTKIYNKNQEKIDKCTICLEEFANNELLRELPCFHLYHKECVDKWLITKSSKCPLCMQETTLSIL